MGNLNVKSQMTTFQKVKVIHDFNTFYDFNHDGMLDWKDFEIAREYTCKLNGWPSHSEKSHLCGEQFKLLWDSLQKLADKSGDGIISTEEWLLFWEDINKKVHSQHRGKIPSPDELPFWLHRHLLHRFQLYDRTSDGIIDIDEFEYVVSKFEMPPTDARKAFTIFTADNTISVNFDYFCKLAVEYYFSNDQSALGNFITGKLSFEEELENYEKLNDG